MSRSKLVYPDLLRIVAIIGVIFIHVTAPTLGELPRMSHREYWWIDHIVNAASRWSVPVFFMISGMFLLGSDRALQVKSFFFNRIVRLMPLFLGWSVVYYVWGIRNNTDAFQIKQLIKGILQNGLHYHLWFIYTLIALYLITPLLRVIVKHISIDSVLRISLTCLAVYNVWFLCLVNKIQLGIEIPNITGYIGYYLLGYYLSVHSVSMKWRRILYAAAVVSYFVIVAGHYKLVTANPEMAGNSYFYNYSSIPVLILASAIFVAFKNVSTERWSPFAIKVIHACSAATFGIYLSHLLFFEYYYQIHPWDVLNGNPLHYVPLVSLIVLVCSSLYAAVEQLLVTGVKRLLSRSTIEK